MLLARKYTALLALAAFVAALASAGPAVACAMVDCAPAAVHPCAPPANTHPCEPAAVVPPCHAPDLLKGACCGDAPEHASPEVLTARVTLPDAPSFKIAPYPLALAFSETQENLLHAHAQIGAPPGSPGNTLYLSLNTLLI